MDADGSFVAMNNIVSQSVPHFHIHVVPRRHKDGLRGFFWPRQKYESHEQQKAVRDALVSCLEHTAFKVNINQGNNNCEPEEI